MTHYAVLTIGHDLMVSKPIALQHLVSEYHVAVMSPIGLHKEPCEAFDAPLPIHELVFRFNGRQLKISDLDCLEYELDPRCLK